MGYHGPRCKGRIARRRLQVREPPVTGGRSPDLRDYETSNCPVAGAMDILGEKWTLLVLRDLFAGVRRFDEMQARLGAPRALLSKRLRRLEDAGIVQRVAYREPGARARHEYRLTDKGKDLNTILVALKEWGDRWVNAPGRAPTDLVDRETGAPVRLALVRGGDGREVTARDLRMVPGPGAIPKRQA
ncbi:MAG: helix-turn-helix transcriptional regulator [Hyphomicrobiales bacterium]|nr:helix-turn-helix transcriptional regulator [Hyphomicrobiales bacterium]MCP5373799.1 helix-turn-helix transcriptional regulator [Hyphomicrobiales bacterium]